MSDTADRVKKIVVEHLGVEAERGHHEGQRAVGHDPVRKAQWQYDTG